MRARTPYTAPVFVLARRDRAHHIKKGTNVFRSKPPVHRERSGVGRQ